MKNPMAFKAFIKQKSIEWKIPAQVVLQNYMFERFLIRLEKSPYCRKFILKGGFLVSSLVGISARTTMDLDITIQGIPLHVENVESIINEIINAKVDDKIDFRYVSVEEIRETEDYPGLRVKLVANYGTIIVPMKLDLTTGDVLTPDSIRYSYPMFSENKTIHLFCYNVETVLAEKLETILSRSLLNTRARDFYDVFLLDRMFKTSINLDVLREVLQNASVKRGTQGQVSDYVRIIEAIEKDNQMVRNWKKFQNQFDFTKDILFEETIRSIRNLLVSLR
jgi:predicted nucleotidyltransferase component of viral defense system